MTIMSSVVRNFFYPLWLMKDGDSRQLRHIGRFDDIGDMSPDALRRRQMDGLRNVLVHADRNTDYYHEVFKRVRLLPDDPTPESFAKLPLLTKEIVRSQLKRLVARNLPESSLVTARTGGSTGLPMIFVRDKECFYLRKAQELYFDRWMGCRLGDKAAVFLSVSHHDGDGASWKAALRNATFTRMLQFDPHHITDEYMQEFARRFCQFRPDTIKCFPNSLGIFADFINRRGLEIPKVSAISCTGENLYSQQRRLFEQTFGGKLFEKYATRENGNIACECREHRGMHVFTDGAYVEILDGHGNPVPPGEMGRLVVTDLFNYGMPMIRYEIGDMAIASDRQCACGSPLPMVEKILGRDRDIVYDGDGNPKPGYLFVEAIINLNLSAQFQVIQTDRENLLVKVVRKSSDILDLGELRDKFQEIVGPRVRIHFEDADAIARDPSGKFRYVMSLLPRESVPSARAHVIG